MSDRGDYYRSLGLIILLGLIFSVLLSPILWPLWVRDHFRRKRELAILKADLARAERARKIREARLAQPEEELRRKAEKAVRRQNLYTQEELDLADFEARAFRARVVLF